MVCSLNILSLVVLELWILNYNILIILHKTTHRRTRIDAVVLILCVQCRVFYLIDRFRNISNVVFCMTN